MLNIQAAKDDEIKRIRAELNAFATAEHDLCRSLLTFWCQLME